MQWYFIPFENQILLYWPFDSYTRHRLWSVCEVSHRLPLPHSVSLLLSTVHQAGWSTGFCMSSSPCLQSPCSSTRAHRWSNNWVCLLHKSLSSHPHAYTGSAIIHWTIVPASSYFLFSNNFSLYWFTTVVSLFINKWSTGWLWWWTLSCGCNSEFLLSLHLRVAG